jgi:ABC-type lipoprotein release transport system permease subunit
VGWQDKGGGTEMKPLSCWNFYLNNKKKVIPVIASIAVGIFLLYFLYIIGTAVINTAEAGEPDALKHFTILYPTEEVIAPEVITKIKESDKVEKVIDVGTASTNIKFMGSGTSTRVLFMRHADLQDLFNRLELNIKEGRMAENEDEIIMHWRIASNKGYKVGDYIGKDVNEAEQLRGKYKLVGIFDGLSQQSFAPIMDENFHGSVCMVFPKEGQIRAMNSFIQELSYDKMHVTSLERIEAIFSKNMKIVYIGSAFIEVLVILVLCITVGNTTYIHFYQRKREFGILRAMGYKRKEIIKKVIVEILNMIVIAFVAGIFSAITVGYILKTVYMDPSGLVVTLFHIKYVLFTSILPIFIFITSLIPTVKMVMSSDKIVVIEG